MNTQIALLAARCAVHCPRAETEHEFRLVLSHCHGCVFKHPIDAGVEMRKPDVAEMERTGSFESRGATPAARWDASTTHAIVDAAPGRTRTSIGA